jgi:hypothetical protein
LLEGSTLESDASESDTFELEGGWYGPVFDFVSVVPTSMFVSSWVSGVPEMELLAEVDLPPTG